MKDTEILTVIQEDLNAAITALGDTPEGAKGKIVSQSCVVAQAVKRQFNVNKVKAFSDSLEIENKEYSYSRELEIQVNNFDMSRKFKLGHYFIYFERILD